MSIKRKYDYIIPIGFFCSPTSELERLGYRSSALPFDWVISDLDSINKLIESNFKDLFNASYLSKDTQNLSIVRHSFYDFSFFHDFQSDRLIKEEVSEVKKKYARRITRLYDILNSNKKILFLRYSNDEPNSSFDKFVDVISRYTENFNIYVISNSDTVDKPRYQSEKIIFQDFINKDHDDIVSRRFFDDKKILSNFKKYVHYSSKQKVINIFEMRKKRVKRFSNKVMQFFILLRGRAK